MFQLHLTVQLNILLTPISVLRLSQTEQEQLLTLQLRFQTYQLFLVITQQLSVHVQLMKQRLLQVLQVIPILTCKANLKRSHSNSTE